MKSFEITFHNLNKETQQEFLKFQGVENVSELNIDNIPISIIELEEENE